MHKTLNSFSVLDAKQWKLRQLGHSVTDWSEKEIWKEIGGIFRTMYWEGWCFYFPFPLDFYEVSWQWGIESPLIFFSFLYRSSFCSPYILVIILKVRYIDPFVRGSIFIKDFMSKSHRVKFVSYSYSADTTKSRIKAMDFRFINGKKEETFWLMFSLVFIFSFGRPV
jgi:hypothetical protein